MKAIQIKEPKVVELIDITEPEILPGEIKIAVKSLGLCGSDLKTYLGQNPMVNYPRIPGHEIGGMIVDKGKKVPEKFEVGLPVTVSPYTSCGRCIACRKGRVNSCQFNQTMGVQRDGAAQELISVPYEKVFIVDKRLSFDQIAIIEPLSVGFHAVNRAALQKNETVLIFGCGMIGIGAIMASQFYGGQVIAVDIDDYKLARVRKLGVQTTINSLKTSLVDIIKKITHSYGPDVVIEAVGHPETYKQAIQLVGYAGRVIYIGYSKKTVNYDTKYFVSKELDIRGSRNALDHEFNQVMKMITTLKIEWKEIVTHHYAMHEMKKALQYWSIHPEEVIKILMYR